MKTKLGLQDLIKEYKKADVEGSKWLRVVLSEDDPVLNSIATIKMNSYTEIKNDLTYQIGRVVLEDKYE
jgi:hypothetical protein